MKQKAIISLLWPAHLPALKHFLAAHEPIVIITPAAHMGQGLQAIVTDGGGTLISLDAILSQPELDQSAADTAQINASFQHFLATNALTDSPSNLPALIEDRLKSDLPATFKLLDSLQAAANRFDVALLVTSEDVTGPGKTATAWAKAQNIPSLHVSHGGVLADPYTVHNQLVADKLAVYGRRSMEGYLDLGYPEERMVVTGNPAWESYAELRNNKSAVRQQLNEKYKLDPKLPLIVFGTTWAANLSAHVNERIYTDTMLVFLASCESLRQQGVKFNAVIKDRPPNLGIGLQRCQEILAELGVSNPNYLYTGEDTQHFAASADALIAVDSNYLIEGMLARTPVINLMNTTGLLMGPSFEAETGIIEVEAGQLAEAIHLVLTNKGLRDASIAMATRRVSHYNHGDCDGLSASRIAKVMSEMAHSLQPKTKRHVWQQYLDVESADLAGLYHTQGRPALADLYTNKPSLILDIGCAAGSNAALIKQRFPGSRAWGIETNRAAAEIAKTRLDRVLVGKFEEFDLEKEGIAKGTLDAVLLADVLEHMYNPWDVMVKLRPYMSPTGQLVLSIPNIRNLRILDHLSKGNWTYEGDGLLDVTHIRFFTRKEVVKFCEETGYRILNLLHSIDGNLDGFWKSHQKTPAPINIDLERMSLKALTRDELLELCTLQFYILLEKN